MNEVSIIINGVKFDSVEAECTYSCEICDLQDVCSVENNICTALNIHIYDCFKKSDKSLKYDKVCKKYSSICAVNPSIATNVGIIDVVYNRFYFIANYR